MTAVTFIDAIPNHISVEEHRILTGATPASFADIPPVLRHKVQDVSVAFDPPIVGFSEEDSARGTLYIIESVLAYQSSTTGRAFQIEYPSITLHAISRGESGPFVYCQLDDSPATAADGDEDAEPRMRELSLTPQPSDSLDPIFEALSICASLHPDLQGSDDDDADDDAFIDIENSGEFEVFTGAEGEELSEVGRVRSDFVNNSRYQPY
ncbi:regulator of volume decrease after cellular swelling-domain-containing protein [Lactarius akahatsu]|uniref:Regulator of volume decrease after cellular swelling-domain-containing protein n=1 Tax=Lactarius akahatsu TaxID=416441 RepID=A0AAD4L9X3_9AGAM|nr:regulator of volume decrease after cellular swelling-domain-containing protein [Lactarius akahatsu]